MRRLVVVVAVVAATLVVTAQPGGTAVGLTVTPSTGVAGGQVVVAVVSGVSPGVQVGFCQGVVAAGPPAAGNCGLGTIVTGTTFDDGTLDAPLTLRRHIYVPSLARWVDCADPTETCVVGAAEVADVEGTGATVPLEFAEPPPPPATRGTIVVLNTSVQPGELVTVQGTGFRSDAALEIYHCAPGEGAPADLSPCDPTPATALADGTGAFVDDLPARGTITPPGGPSVDCRSNPAGPCRLVVAEAVDFAGTAVATPLPLAPRPTISVSPDSGLLAGQDYVQLDGQGFTPGARVGYCLGVPVTDPVPTSASTTDVSGVPFCGTAIDFAQYFPETSAGPDGRISATIRVERYIWVYGPVRRLDCADPGEGCAIHAFEMADIPGTLATVPLGFAAPPPPLATRGTVSVSPSTDLSGNDTLSVEGSGFRPGALVDIYRCKADPASRWQCERLGLNDVPTTVVADSAGVLPSSAVRLPQNNWFYDGGGPGIVDCESGPGACVIAAAEGVDFDGTVTTTPISFRVEPSIVVPGQGTVVEGDSGSQMLQIPVTLTAPSTAVVTVEWTTVYGPGVEPPAPAEPGSDFEAASGTVTFEPGATEATIAFSVLGDAIDEPDEWIVAAFGNPTNATVGGYWGLGFGLIQDDDTTAT